MHHFRTISEFHHALQAKQTTCLQTVDAYLQRIEAQQPNLNAFTEVYAQDARVKAQALDAQFQVGGIPSHQPLFGVVIALKDVICYQGKQASAASRMLQGYTSSYSATAVERLLDAGAILIGSCNCDEFAMGSSNENSVYGPVRNALDTERVPGGSSGGSAVAVQADLCLVSLGSDTGGSVRQPADFCGLVGYKPSYGRISRYGLIAYASSFDQIGIFARTVDDVAKVLEVMAGPDAFDSTVLPDSHFAEKVAVDYPQPIVKPARIAYFRSAIEHNSIDPVIRENILQKIEAFQAAGHTVEPVAFDLIDYLVPTYYVLTTAEASSNLGRYDGVRYGHQSTQPAANLEAFYQHNRSEGFGPEVQKRILLGTFVLSTGYYDAYFQKAQQVRRMLVDQLDHLFQSYDALLLPTAPSTAYKLGEKQSDPIAAYLGDIYTVLANLTGIPAIALPAFKHPNGMPFGFQLMSGREQDVTLLRLARSLSSLD
jgi:aspartyl-tRNA(Asn)/glutamyl-tRNA(Gln) amidotransferase subunit A